MWKFYLTIVCLCLPAFLLAQIPQGISYQAVIRNGSNLLPNSFVYVEFGILQNGTEIYKESQNVGTNAYGLLNATIGTGTPMIGTFAGIDWSAGMYELEVKLNIGNGLEDLGSSPLVSVPYSLYAEKAARVDNLSITDLIDVSDVNANAGQVLGWNGTEWEATDLPTYQAGQGIGINGLVISNTGDTDDSDDITTATNASGDLSGAFPSPQVSGLQGTDLAPFLNSATGGQVLKWDAVNQHWAPGNDNGDQYSGGTGISISGNTINNTLPDQVLSLSGGGGTSISGSYPSFTISSTDNVNDADANPSNELQNLSLNGNTLAISSGNSVNLPAGINYNAGTGISISSGVISNTDPDVPISLSGNGATSISGTYPNFTISSTDNVNDADANPGNELQNLSLNGNTLAISSGNSVILPAGINYSAGTGISISSGIISNTDPDVPVSLTGSGASIVSGSYPNFTIFSTDNVNDADADATNELIVSIGLSGQTLNIIEANGAVSSVDLDGLSALSLEDNDNDTKIQVEESTDEDIIRFDVKGEETMVLQRRPNGQPLLNPNPQSHDVYIGKGSGMNSDLNGFNTAVGDSALWFNGFGGSTAIHGTNNTAVGAWAMKKNSTGHNNVAFGYQSLLVNQGGERNTAIGANTLATNINGHSNTAVGEFALNLNSTGVNNTALGREALKSNTTSSNNTAVGRSALNNNVLGGNNTAIGRSASHSNTKGVANVAIGVRALFSNTDRSKLVAIGDSALYNNSQTASNITQATENTAIGSKVLFENRTGYYNTATGFEALTNNNGGYRNSAFGRYALQQNISGNHNSALGEAALFDNTIGIGNTAMGRSALSNNVSGGNNTAVGYLSFNNSFSTGYFNSTALGYNAEPTASNQVRIGNTFVTSIGGYANWTNLSDARFKESVREDVSGLDFILKLRPVTYQLNMELLEAAFREEKGEDESHAAWIQESKLHKAQQRQSGFIAQEVEQVAKELGYAFSGVDTPENETDHYGLRYAEFVVPLVKAMQEQQQIIRQLKDRLDELESKLAQSHAGEPNE